MTAWGEDPEPMRSVPASSFRTRSPACASPSSSTANAPMQSSRTGRPFSMCFFAFMASFAVVPPATTTTRRNEPARMCEAACSRPCTGPAQKERTSLPVAPERPHSSPIAFAKLPPPLWLMSPQASSEVSMTYWMEAGSMPVRAMRLRSVYTAVAFELRFSSIACAPRFASVGCADLTQPTVLPSCTRGSAPAAISAPTAAASGAFLNRDRSAPVIAGSAPSSFTASSRKPSSSCTRSKVSAYFSRA